MGRETRRCRWKQALAVYGAALVLCLGILTMVMNLWQADFRIPFSYDGDALLSAMLIKSIAENGWYLHNSQLGAPAGMDSYDFPFGDTLHFLVLKLLTLCFSQYGLILNLFFLFSFPAATLSALFVFRRFGISSPCALVGSLLYAFLPYHFLRGERHLFLSMYYLIPLMVMVLLWIGSGEAFPRRRLLVSITICFLTALAGVYYAAFACLLLLFQGGVRVVRESRLSPLLLPGALVVVIFLGSAINLFPSALYWHGHGKNPLVGHRSASETETYGLKISQLLLPVTGHRIEALAGGKDEYNATMLLVNENDDASLGLIGACGFLLLLGCLCLRGRSAISSVLDQLASLNLFCVLLATIGGFGSLIALTLSPALRCYNRISIVIGFLALFAIVSCLDAWFRRPETSPGVLRLRPVLLVGFLVLGLLDQTTAHDVPAYAAVKAQYASDDRFVHQLEAANPQGRIFQLPYVSFPESPPVRRMTDYQHLCGYLHSRTLLWSYGAIRGRAGDKWEKDVAAQPLPQMVRSLQAAGFTGVWVNSDGYADRGQGIKGSLTRLLGGAPIVSDDNHLLFFPLRKSSALSSRAVCPRPCRPGAAG